MSFYQEVSTLKLHECILEGSATKWIDQHCVDCLNSLGFRFLDLHIRDKTQEMNNFWVPSSLMSTAKHQKCISKVGVKAHKDVPQSMSLWIDGPNRYMLTENTITKPTKAPKE